MYKLTKNFLPKALVIMSISLGSINTWAECIKPQVQDYHNAGCQTVDGLIPVFKKNTGTGFIDPTGKIIIPLEFDTVDVFSEGLVAVQKNEKVGFYDKNGKKITPLKYDVRVQQVEVLPNFAEGMATVWKNNRYGFIDKTGKEVIPLQYEYAENFSEGLAMAIKNGKVGFIDKSGKVIVPFQYDYEVEMYDSMRVPKFSQGLAVVWKHNKYGAIDKSGNVVIPLKYDFLSSFSNGVAIGQIKIKGKLKDIKLDRQGNLIK